MATKASFTGSPGSSVGRYEVITKLFESELGTLSAARVASGDDSGKTVALRVLEAGDEALEALAALARRVKKLGSDRVIPVLDAIEGDKKLAVVSEYVEGEALGTLLRVASVRRAALPAPVALRLTLDLLDALEFVHGKAGELEDDGPKLFGGLTPGGVMVGSDGRARLMEIGLSGYSAGVEPWSKDPKRVAYLAPEALRKEQAVGPTADVFTAGVLLWEMLQNKRLFGGLSFSAVSAKVLEQRIPPADAGRAAGSAPLSSALCDAVQKALDRDPANRFSSAADMAKAIRAAGDEVATAEQAAELVEQLAGRTIAGYRSSITKGPAPKAAAPAAPVVVTAAAEPSAPPEDEDAGRKSPLPRKGPPRPAESDEAAAGDEAASSGKKLPPPKGGAAAGPAKPAPKKPALPARAGAGSDDMEVSVDEAPDVGSGDGAEKAAAGEGGASEPSTLERDHPDVPVAAKAEDAAGLNLDDDEDEADKDEKRAEGEGKPSPTEKPAEAALADEPLSDAAVLPVDDEKVELPGEPRRKGFFLAVVGAVMVVAIIVVAASQLGGEPPVTPAASAKPSEASTATAAPTPTVSAAPTATETESVPAASASATATETAATPPETAEPTATKPPPGKLPVGPGKPPGTGPTPKPKPTPTKKYMPPDL